jgi:hypothetical protein
VRPDEARQQIIGALAELGFQARAADGEPGSGLLYGIVLSVPGKLATRWQIVGRLAPGDTWERPTPAPVIGEPPSLPPVPDAVESRADVEALLAAAATRISRAGEIASVRRYAPGSVLRGVRMEFRTGAAVLVQERV